MGLNAEARAALEGLRAQLVADGHPDEREEPARPEPKKAEGGGKGRQQGAGGKGKTAGKAARKAAQQSPKTSPRKGQRPDESQLTPTQKRRLRRKRAMARERGQELTAEGVAAREAAAKEEAPKEEAAAAAPETAAPEPGSEAQPVAETAAA